VAAHAAGCTPIAITDLIGSRLDFAKTLVPTVKTVQLARGDSPEQASEKIKSAMGMQPRVALECTGFESSVKGAIYVSAERSFGIPRPAFNMRSQVYVDCLPSSRPISSLYPPGPT
jgi:threonine dehydrogenase-like Zn-dependent dehydrogenase